MSKQQCTHILEKGKNKGSRCGKNASPGKEKCYIHSKPTKDREIDLSNDPIFSQKQEQKPKKDNSKYSIYHITINTNKNYNTMTPEQKEDFKAYSVYLFGEKGFLKYIKDLTNPESLNNILKTKMEYYFEVGSKLHRLHLHAIVKIKHIGYMKFMANELRENSKNMLGYPIHLNSPVSNDAIKSWEKYIQKKQNSNVIQLQ